MSEEKLTSNTLEIEENRLSNLSSDKKESYRPISEDIGLENVAVDTAKNSNMVRENGDSVQDGADEKMLGAGDNGDKEALALKSVEVKFISGDQNANGDAKIEIGNVEKAFTGMTKDELMKYANDPFWVKLRWILFIAFWALWVGMLASAIAIIFLAPKCAAPTPLAWYEKGPLITIQENESDENVQKMKELNVQGVIYELPAEFTYMVERDDVKEKIMKVVEKYNAKDIKVIIDLTPNYVTQNDALFIEAKDVDSPSDILKAFITTDKDLNWPKYNSSEKAFVKHGKHTFLSQFDNNIDLNLDNPIAEEKFKNVLTKLVDYGVKGFRLINAKHLKFSEILDNEIPRQDQTHGKSSGLGSYDFYNHKYSTYVEGLGNLINVFTKHVHNITNNEGFLSIHEAIPSGKAEAFFIKDTSTFGFDLPKINLIGLLSGKDSLSTVAPKIYNYFADINTTVPSLIPSWMQLQFNTDSYNNLDSSAYFMFISLLRGVQIGPLDAFTSVGAQRVKDLAATREKAAIQHGSFEFFLSENSTSFGYARIKSGNPGYFVVLNPSLEKVIANFTTDVIASEMEVFMLSEGFNTTQTQTKAKYMPSNIEMPPKSTMIFTFVPK